MANVSSIGISSGVLTSELIDQLVGAEKEPSELRLNQSQADVEARLSAFGRIQSALTELRLPARILSNPDALGGVEATESSSAFNATATSSATLGSYQVEVSSLAKGQSLASTSFSSASDPVGTGTLTFTINGQDTNIVIDSNSNSLTGLRDAINSQDDLGVTASIIDTGSAFQLSLVADNTGTDYAMEISVSDNDGNDTDTSGLSRFAFNQSSQNLTETVAAVDAQFKVNGIDITRSSNTIDDVVSGVTFTLTGTNSGSPALLSLSRNIEGAAQRVQDFVDKYNELQTIVNEETAFNPETLEAGILLGDSTLRTVMNQVRDLVGNLVPGLESGNVRSLAEVGFTTDRTTGEFNFDANIFKAQLTDYPEDVVALFSTAGRASDNGVNFVAAGAAAAGSYAISITQAATRGAYTGTADVSTGVTIDSNNDEFTIQVDGTTSNTITLNSGSYTSSELVTEIQSQLDNDATLRGAGVIASVSLDASNQLVFTSSSYGSASTIEFTSVDTNSLSVLGIDAISGQTGTDVAGTINGEAATGTGQQLQLSSGSLSGLTVTVDGTTTGGRGSVTVIDGVAEQLVDSLDSVLGFAGALSVKTETLNKELDQIGKDRERLDDRIGALRERLEKQFIAADIAVGQLQSTQDFISGQLEALTKSITGQS